MNRLFLSTVCAAIACLFTTSRIPDLPGVESSIFAQAQPTESTSDPSDLLVREFIRQVEAKDLQAVINLLSENVVFEQPYQLPGRPSRFEGKQSTEGFFQQLNQTFITIRFTNLRTIVAADGQTVTIEAQGDFVVAANEKPYQNLYIAVLQIEDGKIAMIREYFNPLIIAQTFDIDLAPSQ